MNRKPEPRVLKRPPQGWARKPYEDWRDGSMVILLIAGCGICVNYFYWAGVELIAGLGG